MIPGEVRVSGAPLELNPDLARRSVVVVNDGDRPIQVGSHLHFPDANPALRFDRTEAEGFRLDVPAGTSVRFEPGVSRTVDLVSLAGRKYVPGLQVRERTGQPPTHERAPKQVVPFGTPGPPVEESARTARSRARVSEEPAEHEGDPDAEGRTDGEEAP